MSAAALLPPIPQPPHDPRTLLLNAAAGWRWESLTDVTIRPGEGVLTLASLPDAVRSLAEPSGSFAGLVAPSHVAVAGDGSVFLLDRQALALKRFDPCECAFEIVPCFGGKGAAPRQLLSPGGIAICNGNLYVCDTGNRRIQVFSLRGYVLRAIWAPPATSGLPNPWAPYAIAVDGKGAIWVSDPDNGGVHKFHPSGRWEKFAGGLGRTLGLAVDCDDRVYVVVEGENAVRIVGGGTATDPTAIASRFPALPFQVDASGNLYLGGLCSPATTAVFDPSGAQIAVPQPRPMPLFGGRGTYYSKPLDSRIYRCQWHRIILRGEIPKGTRITISTYCAEAELPDGQILEPEIPWQTRQNAAAMTDGEFDCLVANAGGRYLWLKLDLRGDGFRSPSLAEVALEFPRISLRRYLPAVFGEDPTGADFTDRFLSVFDTTLRGIEAIVDDQAHLFDPRSTPAETDPKTGADFLSWLATWIGISLQRGWPEAKRREWLRRAGQWLRIRGTREGLYRQLLVFLGLVPERCCCPGGGARDRCAPPPVNCAAPRPLACRWEPPPLILEHFQLRRWLFVGAGRISQEAELWGRRIVDRSQLNENAQAGGTRLIKSQDPVRDPFHVYAHKFSVFVPACFSSDEARRSLVNLLEAERPAHTAYQLEFVGPRFRIGFQSTIGFDSVVGRYPEGITLGDTTLGRASVLPPAAHERPAPRFDIGRGARIGSTTVLE